MNKVIIIGRLGQDAEVKNINGTNIVNFSVATSEKWKDKQGQMQEKTEWHSVSAFNKDSLAPYLVKGTQVSIDGSIRYSKSGEGDSVKYFTTINAQRIELLGSGSQSTTPSQGIAQPSTQESEGNMDLPF